MFIHYEDDSMGSRDEEEQRPLTTADIRALLNEQEERINARHKEEIQQQDERHKEEIRLQEERINAHQEEMRALEEATDRRFKDLERSSPSRPQDGDSSTDNRRSSTNSQLTPNRRRRGNSARFSLLLFRTERNETINHDNDEGDDDDGGTHCEGLEEDTFSLMMMNKPFREIPCCGPTLIKIIPVTGVLGLIILITDIFVNQNDSLALRNNVLFWSLVAASSIAMFGPLSRPWQLSIITLLFLQIFLGFVIVMDQSLVQSGDFGCFYNGDLCVPINVPIGTWKPLVLSQYLTVFFALATQNDIFTSLRTLSKLWNTNNVPWDEVIGQKGNRNSRLWACRILLPNVLKFLQAVIILYTTFLVIIQTKGIVDLLKDFTALLVVSEADNIMFHIADLGYFGDDLMKKTKEVKAVQWVIVEENTREEGDTEEENKLHSRWCNCSMGSCVFFTLWMVLSMVLTYIVVGQYDGRYMKKKYPKCNVLYPQWVGSGICFDFPPYNTADCGWSDGDCPEPTDVKGYINCTVSFPNKIGNGVCEDYPPYNTETCGFDGKDCLSDKVVVDGYPNCLVRRPEWIGGGVCHEFAPYNTPECGYDGGRCDPPHQ